MRIRPYPIFPDYQIFLHIEREGDVFEIQTTIRKKNNEGKWFLFNVATTHLGNKEDAMKKFIMEAYIALMFVNYDPKINVSVNDGSSVYQIDPNQSSEEHWIRAMLSKNNTFAFHDRIGKL